MQHEVSRVKQACLLSQNQILTWGDWTHVTISSGLATIPRKGDVVRVFSEGRDANSDIQMCQVLCGTVCGVKLFCRLPHKKQLIRHLFVRLPCKQLKPQPQCN